VEMNHSEWLDSLEKRVAEQDRCLSQTDRLINIVDRDLQNQRNTLSGQINTQIAEYLKSRNRTPWIIVTTAVIVISIIVGLEFFNYLTVRKLVLSQIAAGMLADDSLKGKIVKALVEHKSLADRLTSFGKTWKAEAIDAIPLKIGESTVAYAHSERFSLDLFKKPQEYSIPFFAPGKKHLFLHCSAKYPMKKLDSRLQIFFNNRAEETEELTPLHADPTVHTATLAHKLTDKSLLFDPKKKVSIEQEYYQRIWVKLKVEPTDQARIRKDAEDPTKPQMAPIDVECIMLVLGRPEASEYVKAKLESTNADSRN
jgi:hypothetical protein